jgi:lipopolysaccharide/colanic/teichoic acid biosynthesis glycosyltransferase
VVVDPRSARIGHWLRRYNVDELPQLINVLRSDMSLVGPRPSPDHENQYCPAWRRARLSVRPGITRLWQVLRLREQSSSDFQDWSYYDIEYARHCSLWLDLQLLLHAPPAMFAPT